VLRPSLAEDLPTLRRASPWASLPLTLVVCAGAAVLAWRMARSTPAAEPVVETVPVILPDLPGVSGPAGPAGMARPAAPPKPAPAPAPPPAANPSATPAPPPPPQPEAAPVETPKTLPLQDLSGAAGAPGGTGAGAAGGVPGGIGGAGTGKGGLGGVGPGGGGAGAPELDSSKAVYIFKPPAPRYPPIALQARTQGVVRVVILVGTDGVPKKVLAVDGNLLLQGSAKAYAMACRLKPHLENGIAIEVQTDVVVTYRLEP
jgi:outer membrane biosynthesis protein TonB